MLPFRLTLILLISCIASAAIAQQPGLRSPRVKYNQINTDSFRIIFPEGTDVTAQRIAHLIDVMAEKRPFLAGAPLRKIDFLLQNATDVPNGYVQLGPWRSEFYLSPPQNSFELGSLPWHELLAMHEFRHVQQFSATKKGISKWFYYLFGEEAYSGAVHLAVPNWFTEGDAVMTETALSAQGRGRLASFKNGYRTMVKDGEYWSYAKARNGSLKEFIPSHYNLGYLLVNYGREKYGQSFWDSVTVEGAAYKGLLYSFSGAIQKRTGLNTKEFYTHAMNHYRNAWYDTPHPVDPPLLGKRDVYRDFSYPTFAEDNMLYTMIENFDRIPAIYRVSGEYSEKIVSPGFQTEPVFHARGNLLCWTELRRHPRWWREDYSVIVVYDMEKNQRRTLTHGSSYFMPAISPDGKTIAAVFDNDLLQYTLKVLSIESGEVIKTISNPENYFYTYPQWSPDGRYIITSARLPDGKMTLVSYDLTEGKAIEYVAPGFAPIGKPNVSNEWIYFSMTHGNVDQIFRVHRTMKNIDQVTFDEASKYDPVIDPVNGDLIYARYRLDGKKLIRIDPDEAEVRLLRKGTELLVAPMLENNEADILTQVSSEDYPVSKYPLLARPIRLHSWSLYADDPVYGIELLSENTLNTLQWRSGWEYNQNSGYHGPFTELTFGLWYPQIVAGYSATRVDFVQQNREFIWWQHVINAGLRIPFLGYSGPYSQIGALSSRFNHINTTGDADFKFNYLSHNLQFSNSRRQAVQHAESRFSQAVLGRVLHAIDTTTAHQYFIATDFTVPSPVRNHFFWFEFDFRHEPQSNSVRFGDAFDYARGYDPVKSDDIWRFGASYQFPVAYPDFGIAGLVYFRRIRLAPFFDIMQADGVNFKSAGGEIYFDVNVFNVEAATVGLRWARRLDGNDQGNDFSLILPMTL